ncbi:MAG: dihydroorotate dehydrogenase electron transfer subunit [Spirochaetes bacterium]|nr:dihydroorotate dehydrogenase electron transfer subunit [Spirochaetota bacterium]MBU0956109.1 dihydroorotate dehydrogenase electron transfer subunit [Spirochaetota bacterium]
MKRFDSTIVSIETVAADYYQLSFHWDAAAGQPAPGAFLTLLAGSGYDPALRRPFAFSAYDPATAIASIIFQKRGRGTAWLAERRIGDPLDVLGPLGSGFTLPPAGVRPVLIAGGIGLGPMKYLAETLYAAAAAGRGEAPLLVLGYRTAAFVPHCSLPEATVICTDDGSQGFQGTVSAYLQQLHDPLPLKYYACGPAPMMRAIDKLAALHSPSWEAATEQWMACGVGACMGCVLPFRDGSSKRCCADGPVFAGQLLDWDRI